MNCVINGDETRGELKCTVYEKAKGTTTSPSPLPPPSGFFLLFFLFLEGNPPEMECDPTLGMGAKREAETEIDERFQCSQRRAKRERKRTCAQHNEREKKSKKMGRDCFSGGGGEGGN